MNKLILYSRLLKYFISLYYWDLASEDKVRRMQLRKFRQIFDYARKRSKFYREFYGDHGVLDLEIKTHDDIKKVPIITKTDLRKAGLPKVATVKNINNFTIHSTSGSTGIPLQIVYNPFEDYTAHLRVLFYLLKAGYKATSTIYMVARYDENSKFEIEQRLGLIQKFQSLLKLFQRRIISIYTDPKEIVDILLNEQPQIFWGTPSIMQLITNELIKRDKKLKIPLILYTSETVFENQEKLFKQYLGKKIVNIYGCMESPSASFDINLSGKMNVFTNSTYFEYIESGDSNEKYLKTPIITNLLNFTTPIVRYNVGDLVDTRDCNYKSMGRIYGRVDDIIDLKNGKSLTHHHAHSMFMSFIECEQWKLIQNNGALILQLNLFNNMDELEAIKKAKSIWNKRYPDVRLRVEIVKKFKLNEKSGKFKNIEIIKG
ncbi:MAG: hypothetical protein GQ534_04685 [Candidatus Delongbacteria bacterium]|nr:hypothetical protein [Candidatus Delongbacteria bacterium]